ncbi:hypothetical protein G3O08_00970 [Cryomorpha ignava]|uniref:Uncharacterized protein n=1 Tax=Cryomorpha ignava TaxID=101383 RepID=A0A7K3WKQ2_9FLAO|nr:hypothetical protein [Cryomorpha ignava]NEN22074.1 hypothetical protein [Cryomorpha ignava]
MIVYYAMGKNKLIVWFSAWLAFMILVVFLTQPDSRPSKFDEVSFQTTESAELYFRNVRSFYYNFREEGGGAFDAYRFSALYEDTLSFGVRFVIYNSWRQNMAFVRVDTNYTKFAATDYLVSASANGDIDSIRPPDQYNESHYDFAKNVFLAARAKNRIGIPQKTDTLWVSESDMANIRQTLRDYFKLIGKI